MQLSPFNVVPWEDLSLISMMLSMLTVFLKIYLGLLSEFSYLIFLIKFLSEWVFTIWRNEICPQRWRFFYHTGHFHKSTSGFGDYILKRHSKHGFRIGSIIKDKCIIFDYVKDRVIPNPGLPRTFSLLVLKVCILGNLSVPRKLSRQTTPGRELQTPCKQFKG